LSANIKLDPEIADVKLDPEISDIVGLTGRRMLEDPIATTLSLPSNERRDALACTEKTMGTARRVCPNVLRWACTYRVACSGARCTISMRAPHGSVI
jgi:hypothetical protein